MSYRTPEGKAAKKFVELINDLEFSPAMFASCFATLGGEAIQQRFAAIILGQIEHWYGEGRVPDETPMGRLMQMWQAAN